MKIVYIVRTVSLLLFVAVIVSSASAQSSGYTFVSLHSFTGTGTDGADPRAGLIQGSDGNLYGTACRGGANGNGCVFKVTPAGAQTTLYSFSPLSYVSGYGVNADGAIPNAALVQGGDGNYYGTTSSGGASSCGTVFKMTPKGNLTTLHSFTLSEGLYPTSLILDGMGNFYGTTAGNTAWYGGIFKIPSSGTLTMLYTFNGYNGTGSNAPLVLGSDGNYYGISFGGNSYTNDYGTVFLMTPTGKLTTLYSFTNTNSSSPDGGLVQGSDGNFYGTTAGGLNTGDGPVFGGGTAFVITPSGNLTTLCSFPNGIAATSLMMGLDGDFYGTTVGSGNVGGTVFDLTSTNVPTTVHAFSSTDGANPNGPLIQDSFGSFYGTTSGGASGNGTVFKLIPSGASTYVLWNNSGQASLWKNMSPNGPITTVSFGPYSGWTPTALSTDTSGNAYILWTSTTGAASVWKVSSSLTLSTSQSFGPYPGWIAKSLAVGPDGHVHVLWNHTSDNEASIFNIVLGSSYTAKAYGPYKAWQAQQLAMDANNNTKILWSDASASEASVWSITVSGSVTSQTIGPFAGSQAQCLAVGPDNMPRVLWTNTSTNTGLLWQIMSGGSTITWPFGPYSGWLAIDLSVNSVGDCDLIWTNTRSDQAALWFKDSTGSYASMSYGPYSGWKAIAIAPGQ